MAGTRQEYGCARIGFALDSEPKYSRLHILARFNIAVLRIEELLKIGASRSLPFEISDIVIVFGKIIAVGSIRRGYLCPFKETVGRAVKVFTQIAFRPHRTGREHLHKAVGVEIMPVLHPITDVGLHICGDVHYRQVERILEPIRNAHSLEFHGALAQAEIEVINLVAGKSFNITAAEKVRGRDIESIGFLARLQDESQGCALHRGVAVKRQAERIVSSLVYSLPGLCKDGLAVPPVD